MKKFGQVIHCNMNFNTSHELALQPKDRMTPFVFHNLVHKKGLGSR